jgi:uncharacterized protein involved in exopolysaccharide biosynthesis
MLMLREHNLPMRARNEGLERGVDVWHYIAILRRRIYFLVIPFVLVFAGGFAMAMLMPAIYVAEGKLLVESQQIPTELVRPTITATAKERIQVIEQRVMTRDNLLAIADRYQLFPGKRQNLSATQLLDLMRQRTRLTPFELDQRRRSDALTIALTIAFEYEQADIAMRVANELVTLILNEDARNRTSRAHETTSFLAREVKKLEGELGTIEAQIADFRTKNNRETVADKTTMQLALLKAEFQEKATLYTDAHPEMVRLKRQMAVLEKIAAQTTQFESGLEALVGQRAAIQKNLEGATQRAAQARLGESLERAQFSERLEVLEQAVLPQKPTKPNRPKLLGVAFALALLAGFGAVAAMEIFNRTIWTTRDLYAVADAFLVVPIPYIATKKELIQRRVRAALSTGTFAGVLFVGVLSTHFLVRPLDQLWSSFLVRLLG